MSAAIVVGIMTLCLGVLFFWAFRVLPGEPWQILAVWPRQKEPDGTWRGTNLTYYGLFNGLGLAVAVAVTVFLLGTMRMPLPYVAWCVFVLLAVTVPASKIVNRMVEGHWHGFTIGGASFVGMVAGPWLVWGISRLTLSAEEGAMATVSVMGAIACAYALGEGIGRLACISFGCCYGRPLADCPAWLSKLFTHGAFVFEGRLKKSSYEHRYEGKRLIPVQALTAIISSMAGLVGMAVFLGGHPVLAYVMPVVATQVWRFVSEFLRADYRGAGRITAYQGMALAGAAYTVALGLLWSGTLALTPDVARGLALLWTPGAILLIEAVALFVAIRMGLSTVTTARIHFGLRQDGVPPVSPALRTSDGSLTQD
ncbi:MAG: prolipoprotein diacylglyceryl transferase family protein [bacterium]